MEKNERLILEGARLMGLGRHREAIAQLARVGRSPLKKHALLKEGIARSLLEDPQALQTLRYCLEITPDTPETIALAGTRHTISRFKVHLALATILQKQLLDADAIPHLEECLRREHESDPDSVGRTRLDLAYARMREGLFDERSWLLHENRWSKIPKTLDPPVRFADPKGKTVMVYGEQGFGDNIQFARYLKGLKEMGAGKTILVTRRELKRLFSEQPWTDEVAESGEPHPPYDLHLPIMSLPHLLGIGGDLERYSEPYVAPNTGLATRWKTKLPAGTKIGIAWKGSPRNDEPEEIRKKMERRNVPLHQLLKSIPEEMQVISLQKDNKETHPRIHDPMPETTDYLDTAAIVANLDIVACVDTSVAHLGASMGKPTIMLSRRDSCWRWGKDEKTAPRWYPSMTIIRQETPGDWTRELARLRAALDAKPPLG